MEFPYIELAAKMGWEPFIVRRELKELPARSVPNDSLLNQSLGYTDNQPLGKEPFRRWEPFGIHNSSGFPNRIPAISLKNVQVGAVPSSTVYLQPL